MNRVFGAIAVTLAALAFAYKGVGGRFDSTFWQSFIPGLMENLVALAVAIFVIDRIFANERRTKLRQTNSGDSKWVRFLSNRFAFVILESFGLATMKEVHETGQLDFEFALERMKTVDLSQVFYDSVIKSNDREKLIEQFGELLRTNAEALSKAVTSIYPRPHPDLKVLVDELSTAAGAVSAMAALPKGIAHANNAVAPHDGITPKQEELLLEIGYETIGPKLAEVPQTIITVAERAKQNDLFISFD